MNINIQKAKLTSILKKLLSQSSIKSLLTNSNSDLYETYIFTLVLEAAKAQGGKISFEDSYGYTTTSLLFRTSPTSIYSKTKNYTHAVITFPNNLEVEVHIGIKVSALSGVLHEADIAVIDRDEGITCRQNDVHPRHTKLILAVECKYYFSYLGINLARSFLGLEKEFSRQEVFFVSNTTSRSVEKILSKHRTKWDQNIIPRLNNDSLRLKSQFEIVFRDLVIK